MKKHGITLGEAFVLKYSVIQLAPSMRQYKGRAISSAAMLALPKV